jgi:hypothetical protein
MGRLDMNELEAMRDAAKALLKNINSALWASRIGGDPIAIDALIKQKVQTADLVYKINSRISAEKRKQKKAAKDATAIWGDLI